MFATLAVMFLFFFLLHSGVAETSHFSSEQGKSMFIEQSHFIEMPQCQRFVEQGGVRFECDSAVDFDAVRLREKMLDIPEVQPFFDAYDEGRRQAKSLVYWETAGIGLMLIGSMMGPSDFQAPIFYGGALVTVNAFLYTFVRNRLNNQHLQGAVNVYNQAHPQRPMSLQFGILF